MSGRSPAEVHDVAVRRAGALTVASLLAVLASASYAAIDAGAAGSASGSGSGSCSATIKITGPSNGHLSLSPSGAKIEIGDCLAFSNGTNNTVNIAITRAGVGVFSDTLAKGASEAAADSFTPKNPGDDSITVSSHVLLLKMTGSGSVTVDPAPKSSPTPTTSGSPGGGGGGGGGHHSGKPTSKPTKTPSPHKSVSHTPTPHATGFKLPPLPPLPSAGSLGPLPKGSSPVVAPGLASSAPAPVTTDSSTPVAAIEAGPLEPVEDSSRGLPIAVAVLVILGLASGYGRVLLAATPLATGGRPARVGAAPTPRKRRSRKAPTEPVDKRKDGDHRV